MNEPGIGASGDRQPASVVTVGTFDGVHRGHLAVIEAVRRRAEHSGMRSVVVTFEPHPLRVVRPQDAPPLLTTFDERRALLEATGLDLVSTLPFTPELAAYSPRRFVEDILIERFGMAHLVVGHDHGLGRGRSGDVDTLRRIGEELGFSVEIVPALNLEGEPISSTLIRRSLERGDVVLAARGLGRPYALHGSVVHGDGRGTELGFPTANLEVAGPHKLLPREGIYAVRALLDRATHNGVLHRGPRPTFRNVPPAVELHLFDFEADLYGSDVAVEFCGWIREVLAFASVDALVDAMREDCARARSLFAHGGGACQDVDALLM